MIWHKVKIHPKVTYDNVRKFSRDFKAPPISRGVGIHIEVSDPESKIKHYIDEVKRIYKLWYDR